MYLWWTLHFEIQVNGRLSEGHPIHRTQGFTQMWVGLTETGKPSSVTGPRAGGLWLVFEARGFAQTGHRNQVGSPRGRS